MFHTSLPSLKLHGERVMFVPSIEDSPRNVDKHTNNHLSSDPSFLAVGDGLRR